MISLPSRPTLPPIPKGLNEPIAKELFAYTFIRGLCRDISTYSWDNFPFYNQLKETIKKETGKDYNPKVLPGKYYRQVPLISLHNHIHPNHPAETQALGCIIPNYDKYMNWVFECIITVNKYWIEQAEYRNKLIELNSIESNNPNKE